MRDPDKINKLNATNDAYDPADVNVRERYPYSPPPPGAEVPFPSGPLHYERMVLDGKGCIMPEDPTVTVLYQNACLFMVTAISPIPGAPTFLLLGLAVAGALWLGRRGSARPHGLRG